MAAGLGLAADTAPQTVAAAIERRTLAKATLTGRFGR
jgi:hypothetical protein